MLQRTEKCKNFGRCKESMSENCGWLTRSDYKSWSNFEKLVRELYKCNSDLKENKYEIKCKIGSIRYFICVSKTYQRNQCRFSEMGMEYKGQVRKASSGIECQYWSVQYPHKFSQSDEYFPDDSKARAENFCRNPDFEARPWCYTVKSSVRWAFCDTPLCQDYV